MLNTLSQRLSRVIKTMRGQARLTEENTKEMLREVRIALLEADVALPVVRELIARIKAKAMNEEVIGNLNPGQALVGIVQKELTDIIGGSLSEKEKELNLATQPPAIILLAGLQGAGKTTSAGKLARYLVADRKKKVLTVSTDVYRPAAADQLKVITEQAGADNFAMDANLKPLAIAENALAHAKRYFYDVLIVDTAGRLSIDEAMMNEVAELHDVLKPSETMFVADAMLGQTAVQAAQAFNERLSLTGVILTKLDGDSRGGAALSVENIGCVLTLFDHFGHDFYRRVVGQRIVGARRRFGFEEKFLYVAQGFQFYLVLRFHCCHDVLAYLFKKCHVSILIYRCTSLKYDRCLVYDSHLRRLARFFFPSCFHLDALHKVCGALIAWGRFDHGDYLCIVQAFAQLINFVHDGLVVRYMHGGDGLVHGFHAGFDHLHQPVG